MKFEDLFFCICPTIVDSIMLVFLTWSSIKGKIINSFAFAEEFLPSYVVSSIEYSAWNIEYYFVTFSSELLMAESSDILSKGNLPFSFPLYRLSRKEPPLMEGLGPKYFLFGTVTSDLLQRRHQFTPYLPWLSEMLL